MCGPPLLSYEAPFTALVGVCVSDFDESIILLTEANIPLRTATDRTIEEASYSFAGGESSPFAGGGSSFFVNNDFIFRFVIRASRYKKSKGKTMASVKNLMNRTTTNLQNNGMANNNVRFRPPPVVSSGSGNDDNKEDFPSSSCSSVDVICIRGDPFMDS